MAYYADYTTLLDVRSTFVGGTDTGGDANYRDLIREVSRELDALAGGKLGPEVQTRYYDTPGGRQLDLFDAVWQEITSVVNGDGTTLSSSTEYNLLPYSDRPYYAVLLKRSGGRVFLPDSYGNQDRAITVSGVTTMHPDYANAWLDTGGTVGNNPLAAGGTSLTIGTGLIRAGHLLKLGSGNDFAYASAVAPGATDTVTLVRGVNGSTAAAHAQGEAVYRFYWPELDQLCREAVVAKNALRDNPVGEQVMADGYEVHTPKDVVVYMAKRLASLSIGRNF